MHLLSIDILILGNYLTPETRYTLLAWHKPEQDAIPHIQSAEPSYRGVEKDVSIWKIIIGNGNEHAATDR